MVSYASQELGQERKKDSDETGLFIALLLDYSLLCFLTTPCPNAGS